jgi:hypothetical protein
VAANRHSRFVQITVWVVVIAMVISVVGIVGSAIF